MRTYEAIKDFESKITQNLTVPKGALLVGRWGILYYQKKPIVYVEQSKDLVKLIS